MILVNFISRMFLFFFCSAMISAKVLCLCGFPAITAPPAHAEVVPVVDAKVDGATKGGPGWTTPTPGLIRHFYLKPRTQKGSVAVFCCDVLACRTLCYIGLNLGRLS